MNISFNGTNIFQSSNGNVEFTVSNYGVTGLTGYGGMYEPEPWVKSNRQYVRPLL